MRFPQHSMILATLCVGNACSAPADNDEGGGAADLGPKIGEVVTVPDPSGGETSVVAVPSTNLNSAPGVVTSDTGSLIVDNGDADGAGENDANPSNIAECGNVGQPASVKQVVLAFVFDVSASMGSHQQEAFSRELKWDPVVAATKAFFMDPASDGISATLTFFPNAEAPLTGEGGIGGGGLGGGGADPVCDAVNYSVPDVPLTELPSPAFAAAIDAITPATDDDWRLGTPTLAALEGTLQAIADMQAADPNTKYSIVLVTDGMPALCGGAADQVATVADAVAAVADVIPTYVIGVDSPTDVDGTVLIPQDLISDLNAVSEAGGTGPAFLIDTNDPETTAASLTTVIESIKDSVFDCEMAIPEPPEGDVFDPELVNVAFTGSSGSETVYEYDPACAGQLGWHFNDEASPTSIVLCDSVCNSILADAAIGDGELNVQFGCDRKVPPPDVQ